jgi:hypothetical protein
MSIGGFIARNALRNKRRALLSILSVAMSLFLLVILLVGFARDHSSTGGYWSGRAGDRA